MILSFNRKPKADCVKDELDDAIRHVNPWRLDHHMGDALEVIRGTQGEAQDLHLHLQEFRSAISLMKQGLSLFEHIVTRHQHNVERTNK